MTAATSAQPSALVQAFKNIAFIDMTTGCLSETGVQMLRGLVSSVSAANRIIPCNCVTTGSVLALTQFAPGPFIGQYNDYEAFAFVADFSVASNATANVTTSATPSQTLATIPIYKNGGSAPAGVGDIIFGLFYLAFYNDALNSGNGGLVLK